MELRINGGKTLNGVINISGAKNSTVAVICAAVMCDEVVTLESVPNVRDVRTLRRLLETLGCKVSYQNEEMVIDSSELKNIPIPEEEASKMRASYYLIGSYLSRFKKAVFGFPGGCNLGARPINYHLFGFERLGCSVLQEGGQYIIEADELIGSKIFLDFASVGATINIMLAAVKAQGVTTIENAAQEPEIVDVANFLNSMGAKIRGAGTSEIRIEGVDYLSSTRHQIIPDRIQAGTYLIMGALCSDKLVVNNIIPHHLEALISKLENAGVRLVIDSDRITVYGKEKYQGFDITTQVYPGFPTDLQQPLTTFFTQCEGISTITETIYTERFRHVDHLNSMGANIKGGHDNCVVMGPTPLHSNNVVATDLRAGASLMLAGLISEGTTIIKDVEHLIRGYDEIVEKLTNLGAEIELID